MVHPPLLVALHELKATRPRHGQAVVLLRTIKNDIVGHSQRKELAVRHGLLDCLASLLHDSSSHDVQLQATLIIGTLANAGFAFVAPILASNIVQPLLHLLQKSPNRLVTASLRALNSIASACRDSQSSDWPFVEHVFAPTSAHALVHILTSQQYLHIALVSSLIDVCCLQPVKSSVKSALLEALVALLVDHALADRQDQAQGRHSQSQGRHAQLDIGSLLNALSSVVRGSPYRTHRMVFSPTLRRVFSDSHHDLLSPEPIQIPNFSQHGPAANVIAVDGLLPKVMAPLQKSVSFNYPHSKIFAEQPVGALTSPFCSWLMYLIRSTQHLHCRLAALRLLADVNAALDVDVASDRFDRIPRCKERERQIALFAIPVAVKLIQDALDPPFAQDYTLVKEEACSVLARLIDYNAELQKAALDAGAVKHVSQLFRKSFDPVLPARPMWSAASQDPHSPPTPSTTLGDNGLPHELAHAMKCRASALNALSKIAEKEDANRKAVIDSGIIPNLIDSLAPLTGSDSSVCKSGNTVSVLLAACSAARAMSRSVSVLRTSLIDGGIAKPIFALLTHPDVEVQVAATNVTCNLVLDFSPMRQDLINAGVVRTLCEHAKSSHFKLRQASLWALKHLVLNAPHSMKRTCLEELGSGWLIQTVYGSQPLPSPAGFNPPLAMGTPNAAGEQVDLLNAPESPDMDIDWTEDDEDGEVVFDHNGTRYQSSGIRSTLGSSNFKARLRSLRENEQNSAIQAKRRDMLVQEQALDFIRNLVNGDDNVAMIDHLNDTLGSNQIYEMLHSKLKPVSAPASSVYSSARDTSHPSQRQLSSSVWQPPELISAALGVIVHLAGGSSKHRQQLIAQKELLAAWIPHFSHHDRRIRVALVWAVINLTWVENANDRDDAKQRALELRAMGIDEKVRDLANDTDLDTRERVKTAMRQIDELLEGGRYR